MNRPTVESMMLDAINEVKLIAQAIRVDLAATAKRTEDAHKRIDAYENKGSGVMWGLGLAGIGGGGVGAFLTKYLPTMFS